MMKEIQPNNHRDKDNHSLFLPLEEEFGQYDLYLFCIFLALPANNEIYHCTL